MSIINNNTKNSDDIWPPRATIYVPGNNLEVR